MAMTTSILERLDARDRALYVRWAMSQSTPSRSRRAWTAITHLGGARAALLLAMLPLVMGGALYDAGWLATTVLIVSHLIVQGIKRSVGRPRPSTRSHGVSLIAEPDKFSFPSGHAAAAMSVAFGYSVIFPNLLPALAVMAVIVGMSRVCLGVHYPGDVVAGQLLALATGAVVVAVR